MSSAADNVKPKMVIPDIPAFNKVRPKVVKVPKENVIRELCFELGKFKYNYVSDGINYVTYYNIYNKTKTYIYAEMVEQVYDGERRTTSEKFVVKYSKKNKCEYIRIFCTNILCTEFVKYDFKQKDILNMENIDYIL